MPTIILPYGETHQLRVVGKNASNTDIRPLTNLTVGSSFGTSVTVTPTADPTLFNVVNNSTTSNASGTVSASAKNEINVVVTGSAPTQLQAADPAVTIEITLL